MKRRSGLGAFITRGIRTQVSQAIQSLFEFCWLAGPGKCNLHPSVVHRKRQGMHVQQANSQFQDFGPFGF